MGEIEKLINEKEATAEEGFINIKFHSYDNAVQLEIIEINADENMIGALMAHFMIDMEKLFGEEYVQDFIQNVVNLYELQQNQDYKPFKKQ